MDGTRKGLGTLEAEVLSELNAEGKTVFSIDELAAKTGSAVKARKMASKLVKKKWLGRLKRGVYLIMELAAGKTPQWTEDSYFIASKLVSPYYIGYYDMLHEYGWTEQIPFTVTVATTKKAKSRAIYGVNYKFITLTKKKFFGTTESYLGQSGSHITVSSREKTIVDALDHPEYCGGIQEVAKALYTACSETREDSWAPFGSPKYKTKAKVLDLKRLVEYAEKMGNGAILKRLGYLAELMEIGLPDGLKAEIKSKLTKGYAPLYPGTRSKGKHDGKWMIILNTQLTKQLVLA